MTALLVASLILATALVTGVGLAFAGARRGGYRGRHRAPF